MAEFFASRAITWMRFEDGAWQWQCDAAPADERREAERRGTFRVLTYNIMKEKVQLEKRMAALLELWEHEAPFVVALQEVTGPHMKLLHASPFLQQHYAHTCFEGQERGFKVCVFALREATGRAQLHFLERRACVVAQVGALAVAAVHLTSGSNEHTRASQLAQLHSLACVRAPAVVMGDYNANDGLSDARAAVPDGWRDAWVHCHGSRAQGITRHGSTFRQDKVCWSGAIGALACRVVGDEPITGDGEPCYISDHSGVCVDFEWCADE